MTQVHIATTGSSSVPALKPGRTIDGISAVLLPFTSDGQPDWESFRKLLDRTWSAGLTPAVNMDTGYVHLLSPDERSHVLAETVDVGRGRRFVAGAFVEGLEGSTTRLYGVAIDTIRKAGGTPILFQCSALAKLPEGVVINLLSQIASAAGPPLLAFELGEMFASFGRIYSTDFFVRLLELEAFVGLKHSSLDRDAEWQRLRLRDQHRPDFRVYTGNDLAIDMAFYGSDYLLGLSAFSVEAFALRDRLWRDSNSRAFALNDVLQYLGQIAFRVPVPAYRHSAAQFLKIRGAIKTDCTHPLSPRRPDTDLPLLQDISRRLDAEIDRDRA